MGIRTHDTACVPVWHQAIIMTKIWIKMQQFPLKMRHFKMYAICQPICTGCNVKELVHSPHPNHPRILWKGKKNKNKWRFVWKSHKTYVYWRIGLKHHLAIRIRSEFYKVSTAILPRRLQIFSGGLENFTPSLAFSRLCDVLSKTSYRLSHTPYSDIDLGQYWLR